MSNQIPVFLKISIAAYIITILSITNVYADTVTVADTIQGELSGIWSGERNPDGSWIWEDVVNDVGVTQFNINGFDSNLGTLDEIQFTLDVTVSGSITFVGTAKTEDGGIFTRNTWGIINLLAVGFPLVAEAQTETWSVALPYSEITTASGVFDPVQSTATYTLSDPDDLNSYINGGLLSIGAATALQPGGTITDGVGSITAYNNVVAGELNVTYIYTSSSEPPAPVPEPATMLLFCTGLAVLGGSRMRRKK